MKHRSALAVACVLALTLPGGALAQAGHAEAGDAEAEVLQAIHVFKGALASGDGEAALAVLDPDARIFEGGHAETRAEYESGHLRADMAFLANVEHTTTWSDVTVSGDIAVYLREYTTSGTFRDREIDSHGTETIVLVRTSDGWRIRHIHWSSR